MRPDTITLAIFEKYSPEELADTAQKLVQALADKETAENEKKSSDAVFKERINKHEADAFALAKQYGKGGETAQIGCDIRYDNPEAGKKSYVRMDTGETVETHEMSWEEKQETIQFPLAASEAPAPTADQVANAIASVTDATDIHAEEVTRLCPYPGCTLFDEHEGNHVIAPATAAPAEAEKPKRKRAGKPPVPPPHKQTDFPHGANSPDQGAD